jgi:DNA-binding SARP family transcriptional activator
MLTVRLLGQFCVEYDDAPIYIPSRPAQSLLALLVLTAGIEHRREKLAGELWPQATDDNARANLRHALWRIRAAIDRGGGDSAIHIAANGIAVGFDPRSPFWLDVRELEQAVRSAGANTADLIRAAWLYRGELLPGFYDEWISAHRGRLQSTFDTLLARLAVQLRAEARWPEMIELGRHWLAHGEAQESAFREIMFARHALGDATGVRIAYRECECAVREQFGAEPSVGTRQLFEQLIADAYPDALARHAAIATASPADECILMNAPG